MTTVFIVQHTYVRNGHEESKLIGVYAAAAEAQHAIEILKEKPGFAFSAEGFHISEYEIGVTQWTEGFSLMTVIYVKDKNAEWRAVQAECLSGTAYRINEQYDNDALYEFRHDDIVQCEERNGKLYATGHVKM
jgi:hypothetical protein